MFKAVGTIRSRCGHAGGAGPPVRGLLCLLLALAWPAADALAYRPFDSTDAAVAGANEFELEFAPAGYLREGAQRSLVAPAVIANLGLAGDRELVLQGQRQTLLDASAPGPKTSVVDTGVFLKQVLRRGVLQEQPGASVATEVGFLLPTLHGEKGTGFSAGGIVSQRSDYGTLHVNPVLSLTRSHHADLFLGVILEGPDKWVVRPVAEVFAEQERGGARTVSKLAGAIWRVSDKLSLDAGVRQARSGGEGIHEVRVGLTWTISLGH